MVALQLNANSWPKRRCSVCHADVLGVRTCGCDPARVQDGHVWVVTVFPIYVSSMTERMWPHIREYVFREEWPWKRDTPTWP